MVALYCQTTGERIHKAPVEGYDHPAYIDGWEAAKASMQPYSGYRVFVYDNPHDPLTDDFSQWRAGFWAFEEAAARRDN